MNHDWLGYGAALLTTLAFVPQAIKTIQTRETRSLSLCMYSIFTTGIVLWFAYGLAIGSWPIIFANAVTFLLSAIILVLKLRFG